MGVIGSYWNDDEEGILRDGIEALGGREDDDTACIVLDGVREREASIVMDGSARVVEKCEGNEELGLSTSDEGGTY